MKPIHSNEASFKREVINARQPVLVDFWAEDCVPCKALAPLLEEIAREHSERVKIVKVNVDENPLLAEHYHIESIPTLIYFYNGLVHGQIVGPADKQEIVTKLQAVTTR
jgi:thioredoxin 1